MFELFEEFEEYASRRRSKVPELEADDINMTLFRSIFTPAMFGGYKYHKRHDRMHISLVLCFHVSLKGPFLDTFLPSDSRTDDCRSISMLIAFWQTPMYAFCFLSLSVPLSPGLCC